MVDARLIEEIRGTICVFIENILRSASIRAAHHGSVEGFVTAADIQWSLKQQFGICVYGRGMNGRPPSLWSETIQEAITKQGCKSFSFEALSVMNDLLTSQIDRLLEVAKAFPWRDFFLTFHSKRLKSLSSSLLIYQMI